jgi:UV excision repair protein RAD23
MQLILGGGIPGAGGAGAGAGMPGMPAGMPGAGAGGAPNRPPGGGHVINVTQEELQSIERLEQLGFHRQRALQAFLACDKNEELAANFLFE